MFPVPCCEIVSLWSVIEALKNLYMLYITCYYEYLTFSNLLTNKELFSTIFQNFANSFILAISSVFVSILCVYRYNFNASSVSFQSGVSLYLNSHLIPGNSINISVGARQDVCVCVCMCWCERGTCRYAGDKHLRAWGFRPTSPQSDGSWMFIIAPAITFQNFGYEWDWMISQ